MDIRNLIRSDLQSRTSRPEQGEPGHKSPTQYRISQLLSNLDEYMGAESAAEPLLLLTTDWIGGFEKFLTEGRPGLSAVTARERRKRLATYCRRAIQQGLAPNLKVFPENAGEYDAREWANLPARHRSADLKKLVTLYYAKRDALSREHDPQLKVQTADLALTILGVMLAGIGYEGLASLSVEHLQGDRLYLPHLRQEVRLPEEILGMVQFLSRNKSGSLLCGKREVQHPERLRTRCLQTLRNYSLSFAEGFSEPFTQWVELAAAEGLEIAGQRRLIDRLYGSEQDAPVQDALDLAANSTDCLQKHWYCIRCAGSMALSSSREQTVNGERLSEYLQHRKEAQHLLGGRLECFAPYDPVIEERKGRKRVSNNRLLDRLLFFRGTRRHADIVNRLLMSRRYGFIFSTRRETGMEYSEISEREIERFRSFLQVRDSHRIVLEDPKSLRGRQVRVIAGMYEGYEGEICDTPNSHRPTFVIRIKGICAVATYNVDPQYLITID